MDEKDIKQKKPHPHLLRSSIMQGNLFSNLPDGLICKLFLLQNVSLAFDELYLEKLQIVHNVQLGLTLKMKNGSKAVVTKLRILDDIVSMQKTYIIMNMSQFKYNFPSNFCIGSFACKSRVFGHIWNIPQNTFLKPCYQPHTWRHNFFILESFFLSSADAINLNCNNWFIPHMELRFFVLFRNCDGYNSAPSRHHTFSFQTFWGLW